MNSDVLAVGSSWWNGARQQHSGALLAQRACEVNNLLRKNSFLPARSCFAAGAAAVSAALNCTSLHHPSPEYVCLFVLRSIPFYLFHLLNDYYLHVTLTARKRLNK